MNTSRFGKARNILNSNDSHRLFRGVGGPFVGLAFALLLPSTSIAWKYLGLVGVAVYFVVAFAALFVGIRYVFPEILSRAAERGIIYLAAATFLALSLVFFVVYPLANSGAFGAGSDRDEALDIAVTELLSGNYPYYEETYFGNPISPMPGAVLLAIPFVLLGEAPTKTSSGWRRCFSP